MTGHECKINRKKRVRKARKSKYECSSFLQSTLTAPKPLKTRDKYIIKALELAVKGIGILLIFGAPYYLMEFATFIAFLLLK